MTGISRAEKAILTLTAAFVLLSVGGFLRHDYFGTHCQLVPSASIVRPLEEGEVIDLNWAGLYELMRLPGIGEVRAQAVIDYRGEHGDFETIDDLLNVEGIGQVTVDKLRDFLVIHPVT